MFFLVQIRREDDKYEKGVVVKDSYELACQSFHAYLGAYAYGNKSNVDYAACMIFDEDGRILKNEIYKEGA